VWLGHGHGIQEGACTGQSRLEENGGVGTAIGSRTGGGGRS
jgi:hypothetical protein